MAILYTRKSKKRGKEGRKGREKNVREEKVEFVCYTIFLHILLKNFLTQTFFHQTVQRFFQITSR
jgi:hypothetical protein